MVDPRQSKLWAEYLSKVGWKPIQIEKSSANSKTYAYVKKLPLLGSLIKIPRISKPIPFEKIDKIATKEKALFVKIEPATKLDSNLEEKLAITGYQRDNWATTPTKTIQIDLAKSEEELLSQMEKDTRYSIRFAERNGVIVKEASDFNLFTKLYLETGKRNKFWVGPEKDMKLRYDIFNKAGSASLLFAYKNKELLAAALLLFWDSVACYYHAASSSKNRKLVAPYLILWESIKLAKRKGCKVFDLEGIHDPRIPSTKGWKGFTLFKKGFGGQEVEYVGSFTKFYNPLVKLIFKIGNFAL
jgi:lipid II:glycine glycyltransferase (peptidoglycan interpeptide bridge formation enzyme)